ncbi:MAG: flagellar filament capping protein FliD, partial [Phycisphaerae bacterium]|nr:flagellar filament capping protein FliD [Phycisphaerae bacterium]
GTFLITDSNGLSATVDLTQGDEVTLQDVIDEINSRPTLITASINATGDGLLLTDTAGGPVKLKIAEDGSSTAADLGILGEDDDADGVIDGSFEKAVVIDADDTLDDVLQKIGDADVPVFASIINDGSDINPFRLNLTSNYSGADGQFTFSDGGLGIDRSTLSQGEDAVVFFGGADPTTALLLTSNTNTLDDTIAGVNIDLLNTSDQPVQLTISRDTEAIVTDVGAAAESFNALIDTFEKYDTYDSETEERGLLLGDPTIGQIQRQLYSLINQRFTGVGGQFQFLSQIGFTIGSGARLQFDADKFRDALAEDPDGVSSLFTAAVDATPSPVTLPPGVSIPDTGPALEAVGFAQLLDELINAITDSIDGTLTRRTNNIDSQVELSNRRIDQLNELLGLKRERLEADFVAMEQAIATLQSQQSALLSLSLAAVNTPSVNNSFGGGGGLSA